MKVFDLPGMSPLASVTCPVAVNYAALSPDGRQLAAVGDASDTYLFRATPTGAHRVSPLSEGFKLWGSP